MPRSFDAGTVAESSPDPIRARIRAEYLEMPGMMLTVDQVRRLCGGEHDTCAAVLNALVAERFLGMTSDGRYMRVSEGSLPPTALRADLSSGAAARLRHAG